jgi:hypothetical protein
MITDRHWQDLAGSGMPARCMSGPSKPTALRRVIEGGLPRSGAVWRKKAWRIVAQPDDFLYPFLSQMTVNSDHGWGVSVILRKLMLNEYHPTIMC